MVTDNVNCSKIRLKPIGTKISLQIIQKFCYSKISTLSVPTKLICENQNSLLASQKVFGYEYRHMCLVLQSLTSSRSLGKGQQIHAQSFKLGFQSIILLNNHLINLYSKCQKILNACQVFDEMAERSSVSWSSLISGFAQNGLAENALVCFRNMHKEKFSCNEFTLASVAKAYGNVDSTARVCGQLVHSLAVKTGFPSDVFVCSALVDMYCKFGATSDAHQLFFEMPERNTVSWSGMISGCVQNSMEMEAFRLFKLLLRKDDAHSPNEFTLSSVIRACASSTTLELGMQLHGLCIKLSFDSSSFVGSSLIGLYSKCGVFQDARVVFMEIQNRNLGAWNSMLIACAHHGLTKMALEVFEEMRVSSVCPNFITFLSLLSACGHAGLVDTGKHLFDIMETEFGVQRNVEHYACVVDMLARDGRLEEAVKMIEGMPFEPTESTWGALLSGCRKYGDTERAIFAAEKLFQLGSKSSGSHILLVNAYQAAGRWMEAAMVRKLLRDSGIKKETGQSWISVANKVHTFVADDKSHTISSEIYVKLEELDKKLEGMGLVSDRKMLVPGEVKERVVGYHSERIAVAFGLIVLSRDRPIRIMKNLRVCTDCHAVMKLISWCEGREIILRDNRRFHRFNGGECSCGDYW